jgi:hypothetical protein
MQAETPNPQAIPAPATPEIAPAGDSTPVKKRLSAGQILDGIDVEERLPRSRRKSLNCQLAMLVTGELDWTKNT